MQRAAGVSSFGDMSLLLQTAPREMVELLRITAVVRSVTGPLGATRAERLRLNGTYSLRGLIGQGHAACGAGAAKGGGGVSGGGYGGGSMSNGSDAGDWRVAGSFGYRLKVRSRLAAMQGYIVTSTVLMRLLLATLHVFGQNVPLG